jgi:hypothetical protein
VWRTESSVLKNAKVALTNAEGSRLALACSRHHLLQLRSPLSSAHAWAAASCYAHVGVERCDGEVADGEVHGLEEGRLAHVEAGERRRADSHQVVVPRHHGSQQLQAEKVDLSTERERLLAAGNGQSAGTNLVVHGVGIANGIAWQIGGRERRLDFDDLWGALFGHKATACMKARVATHIGSALLRVLVPKELELRRAWADSARCEGVSTMVEMWLL